MDAGGNLRAQDIGISWQDGETFLHGVRITGQRDAMGENLRRPATAEPYPSCQKDREDAYRRPAMSTPYQQSHEQPPGGMSTPGCIEMSDTPAPHFAVPRQEGRPAHRPAAPIQRFNSKNIGWPAWFRHFRAVADVQGWDKDQRALQMVSYLDEKAMNVAQELSDRELYDYDALVGLLGARFDPASRVSASRSRFHGRTRCHQEDADTYADSITELCRLGYPQSSPELRQELISEQFVRGQSDPELKKYLWVVIRTQKDKKLQTLIEVCTDFASLSNTTSVHRPAEQVFALEEEDDQEEEMFAVVDRQQWNTPGGISSSVLTTGQLTQPLTRVADIQTSATGGDVAEKTSIQSRRVSTVEESLPVEDVAEQFSAHEEEEFGDDPLHCEDPVMHISGTGHWFLEGWIGDHSVEFLVDSGSSVTAISDVLYGNLLQAGAPVGTLQVTARTLRSANGTGIEVLGCSRCSVSFLGLRTEFPIIICSLAAGTDAIIGTDVLGSVLPHTLDIKNGLLFTQGGASLQLRRRDSALSGRVFTVGHSSIPPYSEAVLHCSVRTTGGRALPSSGLLEGLTLFAEETGLIVGRTLVDPSGWKVPVLVSNFGQETVVVNPFTEVGMIAQVTAIQSVTDDAGRRRGAVGELPLHLRDLVDQTSGDLDGDQRRRLAEVLLEYADIFPIPGEPLTGHTDAVEHDIHTGDRPPIQCAPRRMSPQKMKKEEVTEMRHRDGDRRPD